VYDRLGRPFPVALGEPIYKLLGGQSQPDPLPPPQPLPARPHIGPFHQLLRERGGRYLCCEIGNLDSEKEWKLTGWSDPAGGGLTRHRALGKQPATIQFTGRFHNHFDYSHLVLRVAKPQAIAGVKLSLNGREIPIPEELAADAPAALWQIPFPAGMIAATSTFQLQIEAPNWPVTDLALVGAPIRDLHLHRLLATS
jgi:hypothetical protein